MKHIYHFLLVIAFMLLSRTQNLAQITCNFSLVKDTLTLSGPILAVATDTSPWPITARKWTLTTCGGSVVNSSQLAINTNYSYVPSQPGCYCLRLWSRNSQGDTCVSNNCNIFIIDTPKVNSITVTPNQFCPPQTVTVSMQNSAGCGQIDSTIIMWGCGNTSYFPGNVTTATHDYTANCFLQCYDIIVKLHNSCGAYGTKRVQSAVCLSDIHADFISSATSATCVNSLSSTMIADSAGAGVTYCWYINDVQMQCSNSRLFIHTYPSNASCYSIKLVVSKPTGCIDSMIKQNYVCVYSQPNLAFTTNVNELCIDSGQSYTYCLYNSSAPLLPAPKWVITGPAGFSYGPVTGDTICFNTNKFGSYTVKMMGDYGANCKDTVVFSNVLKLKQNPSPCFYASDTINCQPPLTTQFINCTSAPPGSICSWNFGYSAVPQTSTACNPGQITFNGWGRYSVSLTSTTPDGCSKTLTKPNYIVIDSIKPDFYVASGSGCVPKYVTLVSFLNSAPVPAIGCLWQIYKDGIQIGTGGSGAYPHYYTDPGCYSARLTVWTADGCTTSVYKDTAFCLGNIPVCTLNATPDTACAGTPVTFNLSGANCNYDTLWVHYGDEAQPNVVVPKPYSPFTHQYSPGSYTAWVVPSQYGCTGDTLRTNILISPPLANFVAQTTCLTGDSVFLVNNSIGANRYHWQVNCTGDTFNTPSLRLLLPHCDSCRVTLTAYNDSSGCVNTNEKLIYTACGLNESVDFTGSTAGCYGNTYTYTNITPNNQSGTTMWRLNPNLPCIGNCITWGTTFTTYIPAGINTLAMYYVAPGGCTDSISKTIIGCNLSADFTPTETCLPDSFHFNPIIIDPVGYGCDSIVSYQWQFDDGSVSNLKNPAAFLWFGQHPVTLVVTNAYGCSDTLTKIVAATTPVYDEIEIDTNICPGSTICINNLTTSQVAMTETWQMPGSNVNAHTGHIPPCLTYSTEGEYQVIYHVNSGNCSMDKIFNMHVHQPELCGYVSANYFDCPNPPAAICATNCSQYVDPLTDTFIWNFGNGGEYLEENLCNFYSFPGCYPVTLSVITNNGCTDTVTIDTICIGGPYVSSYTVAPTSLCACKDTVHYTIATVGATQLMFISGCNQGFQAINPIIPIGTVTNPTVFTFDVPYCIVDSCLPQITLGNATGCQTLLNLPRVYIDTPIAKFGISTALCSNNEVCFTDSSFNNIDPNGNNWLWSFGDANDTATSSQQNPCHTYTQPGTYTVTLIVKPNSKCSDTTSRTVTILPSPQANFSYTITDTCRTATLCYTSTSTPVPGTTISNWQWCYYNGSCINSNGSCQQYPVEGAYPTTLQITDNRGCKADTTINTIVNSIHHIKAIPAVSMIDDCRFSTVCMVDSSITENLTHNRFWLFASNTSINQSTCFIEPDAGSYPVTLIVSDATGCRDTAVTNVQLNPLTPVAAFNYNVVGTTVYFSNHSTGSDSWLWYLYNNATSINTSPDYTYPAAGQYEVSLIAFKGNCSDTIVDTVTIPATPTLVDTICGIVYTDRWENGAYDISVDIPQNGRLVMAGVYSAVTNAQGYYELLLPSGNYTVYLMGGANETYTQPLSGNHQLQLFGSSLKLCNHNFGIADTSTGIGNLTDNIKLTVIPNPFSNYTTITLSGAHGRYGFMLYNNIGEQVAIQQLTAEQSLKLERNKLSAGLYIYNITTGNQVIARGKLLIE